MNVHQFATRKRPAAPLGARRGEAGAAPARTSPRAGATHIATRDAALAAIACGLLDQWGPEEAARIMRLAHLWPDPVELSAIICAALGVTA